MSGSACRIGMALFGPGCERRGAGPCGPAHGGASPIQRARPDRICRIPELRAGGEGARRPVTKLIARINALHDRWERGSSPTTPGERFRVGIRAGMSYAEMGRWSRPVARAVAGIDGARVRDESRSRVWM